MRMEASKTLLAVTVLLYCALPTLALSSTDGDELAARLFGHLLNTAKCQSTDPKCSDSCTLKRTPFEYCRCDPQCAIYRDCCLDRGECKSDETATPKFKCYNPVPRTEYWKPEDDVDSNPQDWAPYFYWMVADCPSDWTRTTDDQTANLRQSIQDKCNSTVYEPVSDKATGFDYRNEYCALCNNVQAQDILHWGYRYDCFGPFDNWDKTNSSEPIDLLPTTNLNVTQSFIDTYCKYINFTRPVFEIGETGVISDLPRRCFPTQPRTCLDHPTLQRVIGLKLREEDYNVLKANCEHGVTQILVNGTGTQGEFDYPYPDPFCALCNGNKLDEIECYEVTPSGSGHGILYSIFLDINQDGQLMSTSEVLTQTSTFTCSKNQVYDPFLKACRNTIITDCYSKKDRSIKTIHKEICDSSCNGSLIALDNSSSFTYSNDLSTLIYEEEAYNIEFTTEQGEPVVCVDFAVNGTINITIPGEYTYPVGSSVLTYVGCSLSVIGCLLVLLTSALFKELRSLPGKLLMNLAIAILITNLLIILGGPVTASFPDDKGLCVSTAILLHFFCLSQFSWMCVMSTEVVRSFYNAHKMIPKDHFPRNRKLLSCYIILGWTFPLVITLITTIVNFSTDYLVWYGVTEDGQVGRCWINHSDSLIISFIVPVVIAIAFNLVAFLIVCVLLIQARCLQTKLHTNSNKFPYFRASIAIFTVSGITWIFGFIALLSQKPWAWYPFVVLNSTQGLLIFLSFLCTKKVGKLYLSLLTRKKRRSQTQLALRQVAIAASNPTNV